VAETAFRIVYKGRALEDGRMPVSDLAPALIALGEIFAEASQIVYPNAQPVALSVKATEKGSFDVHLIVEAHGIWNQLVHLLSGENITALVNLKTLLIGGPLSLFGAIGLIGRRKITKEEPVESGNIKITLDDESSVELPLEVLTMYKRFRIRKRAREVVAPLEKEGVDQILFTEPRRDASPALTIAKAQLPAYEPIAEEEEGVELGDDLRTTVVQVASVSFEGHKWRLSEGEQTFHASIEDEDFLRRVDAARERFGAGDLLRVQIRVVQTLRPNKKLNTDYHVVRVIEHIPSPTQLTLEEERSRDA